MNRAASSLLISLASLALATASFAQNPAMPSTATASPNSGIVSAQISGAQAILPETPLGQACPVGLRAQLGIGPGMVIVVTGKDASSQKLNLQFSNPSGVGVITHAQITVHGLTAHGRINPAAYGSQDDATLAKQVNLALTVAPGANASTDLLFQGFTSVRWIDLNSLTYADGSTWHASPQHTCQITPDRVMLVASH